MAAMDHEPPSATRVVQIFRRSIKWAHNVLFVSEAFLMPTRFWWRYRSFPNKWVTRSTDYGKVLDFFNAINELIEQIIWTNKTLSTVNILNRIILYITYIYIYIVSFWGIISTYYNSIRASSPWTIDSKIPFIPPNWPIFGNNFLQF